MFYCCRKTVSANKNFHLSAIIGLHFVSDFFYLPIRSAIARLFLQELLESVLEHVRNLIIHH